MTGPRPEETGYLRYSAIVDRPPARWPTASGGFPPRPGARSAAGTAPELKQAAGTEMADWYRSIAAPR